MLCFKIKGVSASKPLKLKEIRVFEYLGPVSWLDIARLTAVEQN